ncbi:MAG: N-acetyltransferase [Oxalobacteraceae bacterium]|nr:MAG: N-acetyltransferase [Oxalobacteraceae bacterium]
MRTLFGHSLRLATARLIIRRFQASDVVETFKWCRDPIVSRFLSWEPHRTIEETERFIAFSQRQYLAAAVAPWVIEHRETGQAIGTCNFVSCEPELLRGEIGYCLSPAFWGQGLATEAVQAVVAYGFANRLERIQATCSPENWLSAKLLRRLGFAYEGLLRSYAFKRKKLIDVEMYALLKDDRP